MSISWNDDLSVNVQKIDEQHKELINKINELFDACKEGKGGTAINDIVKFLEKYVVFHFSTEEQYMQVYNYPDIETHRKEHKYFLETFNKIKEDHLSKNEMLLATFKLNDLLIKWLINHIRKTDKAIGDFLRNIKT
ncbi:MAG: bacteriohemerythrin [Proteobacteria bacterium]|nr:bacteriohemerythrin [Pseudomonadota bacterium]